MRVFIGWDERQPVAFTVAMTSLIQHARQPLQVTPLVLGTLPIKRQGLTPFTYSRFLVPWLCDYTGWALFMDADVLVMDDVSKMLDQIQPDRHKAVYTVDHPVRRFERPSVMLFNCAKCEVLTPSYIESSENPLTLAWAKDSVGTIPKEWNHLVSYDEPNPAAKIAHFTQGLPAYKDIPALWNAEYAKQWRETAQLSVSAASWEVLMGRSVHVPHVLKESHAS